MTTDLFTYVKSVQDPTYKASERVCKEIIDEDDTSFIHEIALGMFYSQGGRYVFKQ